MWKTGCCLLIVWLLAIIGVSVDILLTESGTNKIGTLAGIDLEAEVDYGWEAISISFTYDDQATNYTKTVTYADAYDDCSSSVNLNETEYCSDLKDLKDAGRVYLAFNILAIFSLTCAIIFCILIAVGRCLCKCSYDLRWIIGIFIVVALVSFIIAYVDFLRKYSSNLDNVINILASLYFPLIKNTTEWDEAVIGTSIICLILSTIFSFFAVGILFRAENPPNENRPEGYTPMQV